MSIAPFFQNWATGNALYAQYFSLFPAGKHNKNHHLLHINKNIKGGNYHMFDEYDEIMSVQEVADAIFCGKNTIYKLIKDKQLS